jgi:tetrahydromethanopterin S-methyltransferase subunit B
VPREGSAGTPTTHVEPRKTRNREARGAAGGSAANWNKRITELRTYIDENGHAKFPRRNSLGQWASRRRQDYAAGELTPERIAELESIPGWVWNAFDAKWNTRITDLRTFVADNGHATVPKYHPLGAWVVACRMDYTAGTLSGGRIAELESIDGWVWNVLDAKWSAGVAHVRAFAATFGHANAPQRYISPDGHRTGLWISRSRANYAAGELSPKRTAELESIAGWMWNRNLGRWAGGVVAVRAYAAKHGHARVPQNYESPDGHRTGSWVSARRYAYAAGKLSPERIAELESIPGWVWNRNLGRWAGGVVAVRAYAVKHGHARVPTNYVSPDGHRTGMWISRSRVNYAAGELSPKRIAELESIPGWVWRAG